MVMVNMCVLCWRYLTQPRVRLLMKRKPVKLTLRLLLHCAGVKAAQAVLITLYDLNPDEFMLMLSVLPKTFQVCYCKCFQFSPLY